MDHYSPQSVFQAIPTYHTPAFQLELQQVYHPSDPLIEYKGHIICPIEHNLSLLI